MTNQVGGADHAAVASNAGADSHVTLEAGTDGLVFLPAGFSATGAGYERVGSDLQLTAPDGTVVVVRGYFAHANPPDLATVDGAVVSGDTAARLAGPLAPGQVAAAEAPTGSESIGTVQSIQGKVVAIHADGTRTELTAGDSVFQGDTLESAADGSIGIVLADGTTFSMAQNGRMILDEMVYDPGAHEGSLSLSVVKGVFTFVSGEIAKTDPDAMTVSTPVATIGIRGTQVGISYEEGGEMKLALMQESNGFVGEVVVHNLGGMQILNLANQYTVVQANGIAPTVPVVIRHDEVVSTFQPALQSLPREGTANSYGVESHSSATPEDTGTPEAASEDLQGIAEFETAAGGNGAGPGGNTGTPTGDDDPIVVVWQDTFTGGSGEDTIIGGGSDNTIVGGGGDDTIAGGGGDDTTTVNVGTEERTDTVIPNNQGDQNTGIQTVTANFADSPNGVAVDYGNAGTNTQYNITGSSVGDAITTGAGNDVLDGGDGSDLLYAGAGNDTVLGGSGDDTLVAGGGRGNDIYNGGDDIDTITFTSADADHGLFIDLTNGVAYDRDSLNPWIDSDTITGIENVVAGSGDDIVIGNASANAIDGGDGNDTLSGGAGNDVLNGGSGNDTVLYVGSHNDYTWQLGEGSLTVSRLMNETDSLYGIEAIRFDDGVLGLDADGNWTFVSDQPPAEPLNATGDDLGDVGSYGALQFTDGDLLANDGGTGTVITSIDTSNMQGEIVSTGNGSYAYVAGTAFDGLAVGETVVETFTYTVTNADGTTGSAEASITVVGTGNGTHAEFDADSTYSGQYEYTRPDDYYSNTYYYNYQYGYYSYEYSRTGEYGSSYDYFGAEATTYLEGSSGDDVIMGEAGDNFIVGGDGNDVLSGSVTMNSYVELDGYQYSYQDGFARTDYWYTDVPDYSYNFSDSQETDWSSSETWAYNVIDGGAGDDTIIGGGGEVSLTGGAGSDVITGATAFATYSYEETETSSYQRTDGTGTYAGRDYSESGTETYGYTGRYAYSVISGDSAYGNSETLDPGSNTGLDSHLVYTAGSSGYYYVAVTSYYQNPLNVYAYGGQSGDYVLHTTIEPTADSSGFGTVAASIADAELTGGAGNDTFASAQDIGRGDFGLSSDPSVISDSLPTATVGGTLGTNTDVDFYRIWLDAGEQVTFDIDFTTVDAMVWLYNGSGNQVAVNDDGGSWYLPPADASGSDDVLIGGVGDNRIYGGAGNDLMVMGTVLNYDDWWETDNSNGSFGSYTYSDFWFEYEADQYASGGIGDDVIVGGAGDNYLEGGDGNDVISGASAFNTEYWSYADADQEDGETYSNFGYDEWAESSLSGGAGNDTLIGGVGDNRIEGGAGDDVMVGGTELNTDTWSYTWDEGDWDRGSDSGEEHYASQNLSGGAGNDTITGGVGDNWIDGGDGNDVITGGSGGSTYYWTETTTDADGITTSFTSDEMWGSHSLNGGAGNDVITGGNGFNFMTGGTDDDRLIASNVNDWYYDTSDGYDDYDGWYDAAANVMDGGDGNDVLVGGALDDFMTGGSGSDLFIVGSGGGLEDIISDFEEGDALLFEGFSAEDIRVEQTDNGLVIGAGEGDSAVSVTLENQQTGSGYTTNVGEDDQGNAVVTVTPTDL